jgi:septal ring factor EnvC (AmiA/AmiB activator)
MERVSANLRDAKQSATLLLNRAAEFRAKRAALEASISQSKSDIDKLKRQCRLHQKRLEGAISVLFSNRPVYLIGEILHLDGM